MKSNGQNPTKDIYAFNSDLKSVLSEEEQGHYVFIVADKKKAFLFLFNQGEVAAKRELMDPGVRKQIKSDSGELYGRNDKLERHIEKQLHVHLSYIMSETEKLIIGKEINGVFIGGHQPLFSLIEKALPADLQKKLRGDFVTELNIPEVELIKHCKNKLDAYLK